MKVSGGVACGELSFFLLLFSDVGSELSLEPN